jgi:acetolactate synthase-1/2/3 large subunit
MIAPIDLFGETPPAEAGSVRIGVLGTFLLGRRVAAPNQIDAAVLLAEARASLVIASGDIHISDAAAELAALQDAAALPVATAAMNKGATDEGHPLSVGVVGYFMGTLSRTRHMRALVEEADVILLIGNHPNQNGTNSWQLYRKHAYYIHIDVDGQEIDRNYEGRAAWQADMDAAADLDATPIRPERLMRDLDAVLTPDMITVADASYASI